jgi:N-acetyl sugar amidotransferase
VITYCKNCLYPETKQDLTFNENGVCSACNYLKIKDTIDWVQKRKELEKILEKFRSKDGKNYDCLIPVSGGKDSHYQTYVMKEEFGMNPLLIAFRPREWTELGRKNLENLKNKLNVDCIEFTPKRELYKQIQKIGLHDFGDASWPEHIGIFTVPIQIAVKFNIPLVIWGENNQAEYGGPLEDQNKPFQDIDWHKKYGESIYVKNQTSGYRGIKHMINYGIDMKELLPYVYPTDQEVLNVGVTGLYIGHFIKWDARKQLQKMIDDYGFIVHDGEMEGTYTNFENLDNKGQGLHDYMKWIKFGYGRTTDHASIDIRHNRLERNEGLELVKKHEGKIPEKYLDEYLDDFEITRDDFFKIIDKHANFDLFKKDDNGNLLRNKEGNLEKINYDNME